MELYFTEDFEKNLSLDSISLPSETDLGSWSDEQLMKAFLTDTGDASGSAPSSRKIGDELFERDIGVHQIQGQKAFFYDSPLTGRHDTYVWTTDGFDENININRTELPDSKPPEDWSSEQLMKAYYLKHEKNEDMVDVDTGTELFNRDIGAHYISDQLLFLESS